MAENNPGGQPPHSTNQETPQTQRRPGLLVSLTPVILLLAALVAIIVFEGSDAINSWSSVALLGAAGVALVLAAAKGCLSKAGLRHGLKTSGTQTLPAVPLLALIALVATTWMLSGLVPTFIHYGLKVLNPTFFLVITCVVCALVSVLTGSSWTTIATMGVAFIGIGTAMGYSPGWVAGAIISGAYFGDKISPLSDTTVVASSSVGVELFTHIRYMLITTVPSLIIALGVFTVAGVCSSHSVVDADPELHRTLLETFNISPWLLVIPVITLALIALRVKTIYVLAISVLLGLGAMFMFQPQLTSELNIAQALWTDTEFKTDSAAFNNLASTSGFMGMLPTIELVLAAMIFGATLIGTGMIRSISEAFVKRLHRRTAIVGATVGSGLALNAATADQYLSLIVGANIYRDVYGRSHLEKRLLSRTLEDSVSVTSVLIPWNSCGVTQAAVLGVPTLIYLPYCVFNWLSPLMSLAIAALGVRIHRHIPATAPARVR